LIAVDSRRGAAANGAIGPFSLNASPSVDVQVLGREGEPVVVVDDLLADPDAFVDLVADTCRFTPQQGPANYYPGVRAHAPDGYLQAVTRALAPLVMRTFPELAGRPVRGSDCMSLVTLTPEALNLAQRVPHTDTPNATQIAILHYLCEPSHGGTGFFRHRATGFETITPERQQTYFETLHAELQAAPPQGYVKGCTPLFDQIGAVEARFNRAIFYRSRLLHSGKIGETFDFSPDPRRGRLTGNVFLIF
jgi:hypothetical protein